LLLKILTWLKIDLGGFNWSFWYSFVGWRIASCWVDFDMKTVFLLMFKLFFIKKRANLGAALKFYCGQSLENAFSRSGYHGDLWDFKSTLERYPDLQNDMKSLSEFSTRKKIADFAGMISLIRRNEIFLWKHKGVKVDTILEKNQVISVGFKMLIFFVY
jgi:DNA polymerase-3 subunit epsilon